MSVDFTIQENVITLSGIVTLSNALFVKQKGEQVIRAQRHDWVFDLSGVSKADNVILSILIAWLRAAKKRQTHITFQYLPKSVLNMAQLCGVAAILKEHIQQR